MKEVKCPKCGRNYILDNNPVCPFCGEDNSDHSFEVHDTPKTIEELKQWYIDRNLPNENVTRFFIGKNITEPKAFGIYEENGKYIVYKNKANGQRAIRYQGPNETYAVQELYIRLKEEIINQKQHNAEKEKSKESKQKKYKFSIKTLLLVLMLSTPVIYGMCIYYSIHRPNTSSRIEFSPAENRYFLSDDGDYFFMEYSHEYYRWYRFDLNTKDWKTFTNVKDADYFPEGMDIEDAMDAITASKQLGISYLEFNYNNNKGFSSSRDSKWYQSDNDHDYDWDDDDDWDSSDTDWDSDW